MYQKPKLSPTLRRKINAHIRRNDVPCSDVILVPSTGQIQLRRHVPLAAKDAHKAYLALCAEFMGKRFKRVRSYVLWPRAVNGTSRHCIQVAVFKLVPKKDKKVRQEA